MIQDAHPIRSGIPDCYVARYKIDIVVAATTWTVNTERFPSGFGGTTQSPPSTNAFVATGQGRLTYPPGMRVRGVQICCDHKNVANGTQVLTFPGNVNETNGKVDFLTTLTTEPSTLANPSAGDVVYVDVTLETV